MPQVSTVSLKEQTTLKTDKNKPLTQERETISIFSSENPEAISIEEENRIRNRVKPVIQKLESKADKKTTLGANLFFSGAITGALGLSAAALAFLGSTNIKLAITSFSFMSSLASPIGWAVAGALTLIGGGLMLWGANAQHSALKDKNKIVNYSNNTLPADSKKAQKTGDSLIEKHASLLFGDPITDNVPDRDVIKKAAEETPNKGEFSDIYITEMNKNNPETKQVIVKFADTDLKKYDSRTPSNTAENADVTAIKNKYGYKSREYTIEYEYNNVLQTFASGPNDKKTIEKSKLKEFEKITQIMASEDIEDDIAFFDVTGDGHVNEADFLAYGYLPNIFGSNKQEKVGILLEEWKNTNDFGKAVAKAFPNATEKDINYLYSVFNINGSGNTDANDLKYFTNGKQIGKTDVNNNGKIDHKDMIFSFKKKDFNGDGKIDYKDAMILKSYVDACTIEKNRRKENMKRLIDMFGFTPTQKQIDKANRSLVNNYGI